LKNISSAILIYNTEICLLEINSSIALQRQWDAYARAGAKLVVKALAITDFAFVMKFALIT